MIAGAGSLIIETTAKESDRLTNMQRCDTLATVRPLLENLCGIAT
jgi:hypothetical protein